MDDARQGTAARDAGNPARELTVPHKCMTTNISTDRLSKVDKSIASIEIEIVLGALSGVPLHRVLGSQLVELCLDNVGVCRIGKGARVSTSTKVFLALCFHACTKATSRRSSATRRRRGSRTAAAATAACWLGTRTLETLAVVVILVRADQSSVTSLASSVGETSTLSPLCYTEHN